MENIAGKLGTYRKVAGVKNTLIRCAAAIVMMIAAGNVFGANKGDIIGILISGQTGTLTYGTSGSVTYTVINTNVGNNGKTVIDTNYVSAGLPSGTVGTTNAASFLSGNNNFTLTNIVTVTSGATTPAGTYTITVRGVADNGTAVTGTTTLTINRRPVTITNVTAASKAYDGTTNATLNGGAVSNTANGDVVVYTNGTATFASKFVGTWAVTATGFVIASNGVATNYVLSAQPLVPNASITGRPVTITNVTASNKTYDGSTTATLSGGAVSNIVSGDTVTFTAGTGAFATKFVGSQAVTASGYALTAGTIATNYSLSAQPLVANASIAARPVVITNVTAASKAYDGTTTAALSGGVASNSVSGDTVTFNTGTGAFASQYIGTWAVTASSYSLTASGISTNYSLSAQPLVPNASITVRPVVITNVTAANKTYDGTTNASLSGGAVSNTVSGDSVTFNSGSGSFASQYIGTWAVTAAGYSLTAGGISTNYSLAAQPLVPNASINGRPVTITNVTAASKIYDGTTNATLSGGAVSNTISGDSVTFTAGSGAFASKYVGTWAVTASSYSLTASGVSTNYTLSAQPLVPNASITVRPVVITNVTAANKTYDGTTNASLSGGAVSNTVSGDTVTFTAGSGSFASKDAGSRAVTATGFALTTGGISTNYSLSAQPLVPNATISALAVNLTGSRAYDGTTNAAAAILSVANAIGGDTVNVASGTGGLASKNVGSRAITSFGTLALGNNAAGDYTLAGASGSVTISQTSLTVSATGVNKTYDATTNATVTLSDNKIAGDVVTDNYASAGFLDVNIGTGKTVNVYGISISGADAPNYNCNTTASTTANITDATITVTAIDTNRVYGAADPAFTASYSGFVGGDTVAVISGSPSFSTTATVASNVGIYTIIVTNGTLSATNYGFTFVNGQLTITQASSTNIVSVSANPSPTGSNVTLTATLSALAPGSGTATGTAQFIVDGSLLGAPATLSGGVANFTTNSLTHGYHTIAAEYAGDGNFYGSTNSLSPNLLIDTAPVAGSFSLNAIENVSIGFNASKVAAVGTDADHDALSIQSVSATSAQGGTVSKSGNTITYLSPTNYTGPDSIAYVIADSFGVTNGGTVTVTVNAGSTGETHNMIHPPVVNMDGSVTLTFATIPNYTYQVQATTNLTIPVDWETIGSGTAATNGAWQFTDTNAMLYPVRYYRTFR